MTAIVVALYLAAIVVANLLTAEHGPKMAVVNAFLFIGLDLVCRDYLHDRWRSWTRMLALIVAGSALSYVISPDAGRIALASAIAFAAMSLTDALVYSRVEGQPWLERANLSNIPSAVVDSVLFAWIAFGGLDFYITVSLIAAKIGGGLVWSFVLKPVADRPAAAVRTNA